MTAVTFGTPDDHAVVMYDRATQECVVVCSGPTHLQDAIAVVNSINAKHAYIIAPAESHNEVRALTNCKDMELYDYIK